jgi:RNA polymerase sigma factor (sigma-70 family)
VQPASCRGGTQVRAEVGANRAIEDVLPPLYARLRSRLSRVLYRYHIPADDGEDLLQTTLLLAVAKWNDIRDPEAWLIGTLQKRCILYWRTRRSQLEDTRPGDELDRECGGEPDQTRCERFADLAKVWHLLPPTQRRLLVLRFQEGMSPREAAQAVGIAHSSVRKTTNRAFERLREALGTVPPRRMPGGRRLPRQPVAAPALAKILRADGGAGAAWMAAVDGFTALKAPYLRARYSRDLAAAGIALGAPALAELKIEDLAAYRLALGGTKASLRAQILYCLRSFLLWAGERGEHALQRDSVCEALRVCKTIRREPAGAGATAEWNAAVGAFLAASPVQIPTRNQYRYHLFAAGAALGWRELGEITERDLLAFRAALLADGRAVATRLGALLVVRCFLLWAGERGLLTIVRDVIRVALEGWNSRCTEPPAAALDQPAGSPPALGQPSSHAAAGEARSAEGLAPDRRPGGGSA